jgi:hypothetical protein
MLGETLIRTFKCDEDSCGKQFALKFENQQLVSEPAEELKQFRTVKNGQGKEFAYCSGSCESKAASAGKHDFVEPTRIKVANDQDAFIAAKASERLIELRG